MDLSNLSKEQIQKAAACKTPEEILALAQSEGVELTDEQLEAVSGGEYLYGWGVFGTDLSGNAICPFCGSHNTQIYTDGIHESYGCYACGQKWDFYSDTAPAYAD